MKMLLLTTLFISFLFGDNQKITAQNTFEKKIEATYKISYGIFGELGVAKTALTLLDNKQYSIEVHAYATGVAKALSFSKEEFYTSQGEIKNGFFLPHFFSKRTTNAYKKRFKTFEFDHQTKQVTLHEQTKRLMTKHDYQLNATQYWKENQRESVFPIYLKNDILSMFFNLKAVVPNFKQGSHFKLFAIGANKTDGKIDIFVPKDEAFIKLQQSLQSTSKDQFIAQINQKIFSSDKGELLISLNDEGFCNKAILKDVLVFGDIKAELINFNIKENP